MTHEDQLLIGERLRERRDTLGYSQEYLAEQVGISLRYYQMLERGERKMSLDTLIQLSRTLTVSMDHLLFGAAASGAGDPVAEIYASLTPNQRDCATKILRLYAEGCHQK